MSLIGAFSGSFAQPMMRTGYEGTFSTDYHEASSLYQEASSRQTPYPVGYEQDTFSDSFQQGGFPQPGLAEEVPSSAPTTALEFLQATLIKLDRRFQSYKQQLATLDARIDATVNQNAQIAMNRLEFALSQVYKLAVYIRGGYDEREDDEALKRAIFAPCIQAFTECQTAATNGLQQLSDISMKVASLQSDDLQDLKRQIEEASHQVKVQTENNAQQLEQIEDEIRVWNKQYKDAEGALQRAKEKEADLGNQILNAFSFLDRVLREDLDGLRRMIAEQGNNLRVLENRQSEGLRRVMRVTNQKSLLELTRMQLSQIGEQLPLLQSLTGTVSSQASKTMDRFVDLKGQATKLLLLVNEMQNRATVTMRQAYKKSMFADGILKLCRTSLVDSRVCDEVQLITGEITGGYSGQEVPQDVANLLAEVKGLTEQTMQKSITA